MVRSTKLLTMMRKKNYEFWSQFHNFWRPLEFTMNLQFYEYFQKGLKQIHLNLETPLRSLI
jgi:hypothetical protein